MAKIINNPTDNDVQITISGIQYVVQANGASDVVSDSVAEKWVKTHGFLVATDAETPSVAKETTKSEAKKPKLLDESLPEKDVDEIKEVTEEMLKPKAEAEVKKPKRNKKSSSK